MIWLVSLVSYVLAALLGTAAGASVVDQFSVRTATQHSMLGLQADDFTQSLVDSNSWETNESLPEQVLWTVKRAWRDAKKDLRLQMWICCLLATILGYAAGALLCRVRGAATRLMVFVVYILIISPSLWLRDDWVRLLLITIFALGITTMFARASGITGLRFLLSLIPIIGLLWIVIVWSVESPYEGYVNYSEFVGCLLFILFFHWMEIVILSHYVDSSRRAEPYIKNKTWDKFIHWRPSDDHDDKGGGWASGD